MLRKRATAIIITKKGVLLAKHFLNFRYGLVGGGIKKNENPRAAMKRELFEELGVKVKKMNFLFELIFFPHKHYVFLIFLNGKIKKSWEIREVVFHRKGKKILLNNYTKAIFNKAGIKY